MIHCHAPGKVILFGEYAVLHGNTAVVAAIDRRAHCRIREDRRFSIAALGAEYRETHLDALARRPRMQLVASALQPFTRERVLPKLRIEIDSDAFRHGEQKLGLGSSAAVAVALTHAMKCYCRHLTTPQELFQSAYRSHKRAQQGVGSGIDIAASCAGGLLAYQRPRRAESTPAMWQKLELPDDLVFDVVWSGRQASTVSMVERVDRFCSEQPAQAQAIFRNLGQACDSGFEALRSKNTEAFLAGVADFTRGLERLGEQADAPIIDAAHRRRALVASAQNAVYKPSGAGGGDIGVAFYRKGQASPFSDRLDCELDSGGSCKANS